MAYWSQVLKAIIFHSFHKYLQCISNMGIFFRGFPASYSSLGVALVDATLTIYNLAMRVFLPTPAKSHYLFNLRDFSHVIQGITLSRPSSFTNIRDLQRLWIHEVDRECFVDCGFNLDENVPCDICCDDSTKDICCRIQINNWYFK